MSGFMSKHPVSYTTFLQGIMYFILFRILYCFPILRMLFRTFPLYDSRLLHFRAYHYPLDTLPGYSFHCYLWRVP